VPKIEKRSGGFSYRFVNETGRQRRRTFDTLAEAKVALAEDVARVARVIESPVEAPRERFTFDAIASKYLEQVERGSDIRSKKDPRSIVNAHLRPFFGALFIDAITAARIDAFREKQLAIPLAPRTVDHHLMTLSAVFKFAREHEYSTAKPIIRRPRCPKRTKKDLSVIPDDRISHFLDTAQRIGEQIGRRGGDPFRGKYLRLLYFTALSTGLRKGEIACLLWTDLDFESGLIHVDRAYNGAPKNGDPRSAPMTLAPGLVAELRSWQEQCSSPFVFPNPRGGRLAPSSRIFNETFQRVRDAAGLDESVTFHSCRHSFATLYMEQENASLWRLKDYLGHGSIALTEIYAHRDRNAAKKDAGILEVGAPRLRVVS
jgi:integrase